MPWVVKKKGSQWCVYKKGGSTPIKGGCHASKEEARNHQKALYKNVEGASTVTISPAADGTYTVSNVPIASTGIDFPLSTGKHTITEEDLQDAVAAYNDPNTVAPRIKLGHSSAFNDVAMAGGEPAFGRVENMRLDDNGQTIFGDYTGVPEWLAKILPIAYPSRSIDGALDVETVTGKKYSLMITDVSLLGVLWPGCTVIEDLPMWYGSDVPEGVQLDMALTAAMGGGVDKNTKVTAAVDIAQVQRKFYSEIASGDNYWWWIRAERFDTTDGLQLIVDTEDGDLVRIPVSVEGSDIKFGDPVDVTAEYPDKPQQAVAASAVVASLAAWEPEKVAIYASRADTDPRPVQPTQKGGSTLETKALAKRLGLPEDATEEQINATLDKRLRAETTEESTESKPAEGTTPDNGEESTEEESTEETTEESTEGEETTVEAQYVKLDKTTYDMLVQGAKAGQTLMADRVKSENETVVNAAIKEGKIPPASREHYVKLMAADRAGTSKLLSELQAGVIPVNQVGHAGGADGVTTEAEGLPDEWFPGIAAQRERAKKPQRVMHAREA